MGHSISDPCISYGRGGAGNMHRRSSLRSAFTKLSKQPATNRVVLSINPDDYYANSKSEPRRSSSLRSSKSSIRSASTSTSTSGDGRSSMWRSLFRREMSVEKQQQEEEEDTAEESE